MQSEPSLLLVGGGLDAGARHAGHGRASDVELPAAVTQALLTRVPAAFHGGINDVLLTGLALAVADWCRRHVRARQRRGSHAVLLDLEGHGREELLGREEGIGRRPATRCSATSI